MKDLTLRAILVSAVGSIIVSMSSIYVALRMGALPWPTVFAALFSMFILKFFKASLNEINVAHTGISAGGLVAGGLAFTIPSVWIVGERVENWVIYGSALLGAFIGVGLTMTTRRIYVVERNLPFPMGIAAAETLKAGDEGGSKARMLFTSMGISALFTYLRDGLKIVPVIWWKFGMFPMAVGIGFIIGALYTVSWFAGGITSQILGAFGITTADFGLGMIVGGGIGMMLLGIIKSGLFSIKYRRTDLIVLLLTFLICVILGLGVLESFLFMVLAYIIVHMAASVTGTTAIDPMEVFAIIILMILRGLLDLFGKGGFPIEVAVFIAGTTAVATGIAGDSLQDMKTGYILKTDPKAQLVSEAVGAVVGVFIASYVLIVLHMKFGSGAFGPGSYFPVPQATAVSNFIKISTIKPEFIIGIVVGGLLQILKLPALTFGIGLYLPLFITLPVAVGGFIRWIVEVHCKKLAESGNVIASGLIGGEGLTGVILGLLLGGKL